MDNSKQVYKITNLGFSYPGGDHFRDLNFEIFSGEKIAIIGPNGSGKSTLLNLLAGFEKPDHGDIIFGGRDLHGFSDRERAKKFTYLQQFGKHVGIELRVYEFVEMGLFSEQGRFESISENQKTRIKSALELFALLPFKDRHISTLSGGEYQRARLARSFLRAPKIYLLDEPSAALDIKFQLNLWRKIQYSNEETIVAAVHDVDIATRVFERVLVLNARGDLVADTKQMTVDILEDAFDVRVKKIDCDNFVHWHFSAYL